MYSKQSPQMTLLERFMALKLLIIFIFSHASGSCHLRLANTDILVGVKAELESPLPEFPDRFYILSYIY